MSLSAEIVLKGQKVVFKHTDSDSQAAIELAAAKIREAEERAPQAASHQIALLALVDLASQYLAARDRTDQYQKKVQAQIQEKSELIKDLLSNA